MIVGGEAMIVAPDLAPLLQRFFSDRLIKQKDASAHTISSYRDTFRLLLKFLERRLRKPPSRVLFEELRPPLIVAFVDELETVRKISARSRNLRLTAIRSFFRYAAFELPTHAAQIQRVLAIPGKRYPRTLVNFLSREEAEALLDAPDLASWSGRRDCALKQWSKEPIRGTSDLVFTNARGGQLSADGVQYIVANHVTTASAGCPTLASKRVTPHVCRHTAAMELLLAGVDRTVIALWLGHESIETTQIYLDANLAMKEEALAKVSPFGKKPQRYKPDDSLLAFLKAL
jgi:site-specific recombinase XerD